MAFVKFCLVKLEGCSFGLFEKLEIAGFALFVILFIYLFIYFFFLAKTVVL